VVDIAGPIPQIGSELVALPQCGDPAASGRNLRHELLHLFRCDLGPLLPLEQVAMALLQGVKVLRGNLRLSKRFGIVLRLRPDRSLSLTLCRAVGPRLDLVLGVGFTLRLDLRSYLVLFTHCSNHRQLL
jgi:hypothetical protein